MKKLAIMFVLLALTVPVVLAQEVEQKPTEELAPEELAPEEIKKDNPMEKQKKNPDGVQTLFDSRSGSGGYGAFTVGYTQINGRDAILMGGRGEWVVGHGFGLGVGGYGFVNDPIYNPLDQLNYSLAGGYGGLIMEPIIMGWYPVHFAFPILIGAGGVASTSYSNDWDDPYQYYDGYVEDATAFFVAEFGVELEFNLVRFFRLALFGSYRYTSDIIMQNTPTSAVKGWSAGMTFKFGSF